MKFDTLKKRMEYFKDLCDYKLTPNSYVLIHIDGRAFSNMIKHKYKLPFDDNFIEMMNETAKYICENVQGCKLGYVQSDEMSFVLTDFDTIDTDSFFKYRLCKLLPLLGGMATAKFNQLITLNILKRPCSPINHLEMVQCEPLVEFDCKAWNVPSYNDVYAWFKYRQNDCIRNSKNQVLQQYYSNKELYGKTSDEMCQKLKDERGVSWWQDFDDGKKFGRFIFKRQIQIDENTTRTRWECENAQEFNKEWFEELNIPRI